MASPGRGIYATIVGCQLCTFKCHYTIRHRQLMFRRTFTEPCTRFFVFLVVFRLCNSFFRSPPLTTSTAPHNKHYFTQFFPINASKCPGCASLSPSTINQLKTHLYIYSRISFNYIVLSSYSASMAEEKRNQKSKKCNHSIRH